MCSSSSNDVIIINIIVFYSINSNDIVRDLVFDVLLSTNIFLSFRILLVTACNNAVANSAHPISALTLSTSAIFTQTGKLPSYEMPIGLCN